MEQIIITNRNEGADTLTKEVLKEVYQFITSLNNITVQYEGRTVGTVNCSRYSLKYL